MNEFLSGKSILKSVKSMLNQASLAGEETIDLAVAFWGKRAIERLELPEDKQIRIMCDLTSGGCNPSEIAKLRGAPFNRNVKVRHVAGLHSKVYRVPGHVIVGSANASANGLGDEGNQGTIEAAIKTNDKAVVDATEQWFNGLWNDAQTVTETLMRQASEAWLHRQPRPLRGETVLQKYLSDPEWFRRRVIVTFYNSEASEAANRKFESVKKRYYSPRELERFTKGNYPLYDENVADVSQVDVGDFVIDSVSWEIFSILSIEKYSAKSCIVLLKPEKDLMGLDFPAKQRKLLHKAIAQHFKGEHIDLAWMLEELPTEIRQYLRDNFSPRKSLSLN